MAEKSVTNEIRPFKGLTESLAERFEVAPEELVRIVKSTCFPDGAASDGQLMMLLSFAKTYDLNPLASECYAFIDKKGKMHVGVQVDGWSKIANRQENFDGQEIEYENDANGNVTAITSKTFVKGRAHPTIYRAVMKEWKRATDVWNSMPSHQLFVKARDEGIRFAFGVPAYDPDDEERFKTNQPAIETTATHVEDGAGVSSQAAGATTGEAVPPTAEPAGAGGESEKPKRGRPRAVKLTPDAAPAAPASEPAAAPATAGADDLAAFIEAHKVPQARVNMAMTKAGVERMDQLTPEQSAAILAQFTKSYGENNAKS
jgi:phage recombination protein Bet